MRVAIVNDQRLATEALRRVVLSDARHQIAWFAADGDEAVHLCRQDPPDVVLMDLVMPNVNGAEATRRIMRESPVAILVVTSGVQANFGLVCEALGHGAYDAVTTPMLGVRPPAEAGAELLAKLDRVDAVNRRLRCQGNSVPAEDPPGVMMGLRPPPRLPLVAVGTSTGGPLALAALLGALPADFPAAVLVVQHMSAEHIPPLVHWLQSRSALRVRVACAGETPEAGVALVACSADHLVVRLDGRLDYVREPADYPYRPSVDVLFHSLARKWPVPGVAALLTGIGRDGADGLLALREAGWKTVAQDEASCVVHGMPRAAEQLGACCRVLPLDEIGTYLLQNVRPASAP